MRVRKRCETGSKFERLPAGYAASSFRARVVTMSRQTGSGICVLCAGCKINSHMVILFLYTYLVIRGIKVPPGLFRDL